MYTLNVCVHHTCMHSRIVNLFYKKRSGVVMICIPVAVCMHIYIYIFIYILYIHVSYVQFKVCIHVGTGVSHTCTIQYRRRHLYYHLPSYLLPWYLLPWYLLPWYLLPWYLLPWNTFNIWYLGTCVEVPRYHHVCMHT